MAQDLFLGVFEKSAGSAWQARFGLDANGYQQMFNQLNAQNYRVHTVSGYASGATPHFAALWLQGGGPAWEAHHGMDSTAYQQAFDQMKAQGYRLRWVSTYSVNNQDRYAALWEKAAGPAWQARHRMNVDTLHQVTQSMAAQGFRPVTVSACNVGGQDLFAGLWEQDGGPAVEVHHGMTGDTFQQVFDRLVSQGWRLKHVHGYAGVQALDVSLRFAMQTQQQSNWCWSATTVSITKYYQPASTLTQCALVNSRRGRTDCCSSGNSDACNQPDRTDEALQGVGHLASKLDTAGTRAQVLTEMLAGRPIALRIRWGTTDFGHAIAIYGMDEGDLVLVRDPINGDWVGDFDVLLSTYQGNGNWNRTYFTKA